MNEHILLVMKYLNDKDSVSQEELRKSRNDAAAAADAAGADIAAYAAYTAAYAAYYATYTAAAAAAADYCYAAAAKWVSKYFERTGEDKQEYINYLNRNWIQRFIDKLLF